GENAIAFEKFQTDNLPSEKYDKVMLFLEEIINGTYNPSTLREQMDENLYSRKSRARQDLRLLGFLNESHEMNQLLLSEYVQSKEKNAYIAQLVLKQEY
ncbi:restriction endonuclease, partial [Bacillus cereus]